MKSVGIDIGSYSIKVAEIEATGKNAGAIIGFHEHPLNPDLRADRHLEMIEALRKIASLYDHANTRFVVAVPQNEISIRLKRFPFKERQKILKSLAFELEDEIPLDLDETVFEAKICEIFGNSAEVLTIACPKDSVQATLERAGDGGLDPEIISSEGLAMSNCFERWWLAPPQISASDANGAADLESHEPKSSPEARIVLNIGHARTILLCYREDVLIAVRSILWGGVEVADALAKTFSVPFLEGINILKKKSFILMNSAGASRDQVTLSKAVSSQIDNLVREVRLTLLDLKTEHNVMLTRLELFGGASQIQNLAPYLTQMLEIPSNVGRHFQNHRSVRMDSLPGLEAVSATAIGLAIEGIKKPRNPAINFRRGDFARQNKTLQLFWEKWRPAIATATVAFFLFTGFSFIRDIMADDLVTSIEEKVSEQAAAINLPKNQRSIGGVRKFIKETKDQVQKRRQLMKLDSYNSAMDVLQEIVSNMPIGENRGNAKLATGVRRLHINEDQVTFEGVVANAAQVEAVRQAIEKVALPKSVTKGNATRGGTGVPFSFVFKVKRLE